MANGNEKKHGEKQVLQTEIKHQKETSTSSGNMISNKCGLFF
jgi:hypothetical protein